MTMIGELQVARLSRHHVIKPDLLNFVLGTKNLSTFSGRAYNYNS